MLYFKADRPARKFGHKGKSITNKKLSTEKPLISIARSWVNKVHVLCFDEFFVNDIGDAILLAGLFDEMFKQGMVLIAASNCKPEQLYKNGLQRERFLPTIDLINRHCQVISVNGDKDHRLTSLSHLEGAGINYSAYVFPHIKHENFIRKQLKHLAHQGTWQSGVIHINHRNIAYLAKSKHVRRNVIAFDFLPCVERLVVSVTICHRQQSLRMF